jgi:hypothetical protein
MEDSSAAIYSEAKSEYTKQLVFNFQPVLLRFFLDRFEEVKASSSVVSKSKSSLSEFQDSLSQIPEWNLDKVHTETTRLLQAIQCDYTEDLITAVFIAHTKILSAIRLHSKPRRKINITVPKPDHFMHRTMSECSRLLWSNVYLFSENASSLDKQKNMNEVNRFLEEGILQAIRNLLPVKSILRDSLQEEDEGEVKLEEVKAEEVKAEEVKAEEVKPEPDSEEVKVDSEEVKAESEEVKVDSEEVKPELEEVKPEEAKPSTLIIDTERSVGFTGIDSIFGTSGEAELRESIEESDDLKIIGDLEDLDIGDIEDLNAQNTIVPMPLAADDYETL